MKKNRPRILLVCRCFIKRRDGRFLIIKKVPTSKSNPNKWESVGGKADEGEDIFGALAREVKEETGLTVKHASSLVFSESYVRKSEGIALLVLTSIATCQPGEVTLSNEHCKFAWVRWKGVLASDLTEETRRAAEALSRYGQ